MNILKDKVALVTGASRGIGQAIACKLAHAGAIVIGTATTTDGATNINAQLSAINPECSGYKLDVTDEQACNQLFEELQKKQRSLQILVNNAGITRDQLSLRLNTEDWQAVINTNLTAVFRLSRLALKPMMKAREGRIINITSVIASVGNPGQANYAAAKAGVEGMSRALAREVGSRNITVNCVAPGFIETDMTDALPEAQRLALKNQIPLGRLGSVDDIAAAVSFLASPQAAYITGTTLHVNGGMYMG